MHNKKIIAKGLVFATTLVNIPIDSLANTIEETKITNTEDNTKEGESIDGIKKFFAKIVEPIEELISEPKEVIKVNKSIVRGSVLEISLADGQFVEDLTGNPGGYETVKVTTTGSKKLVSQDYDNLRLSGISKVDLSDSVSDEISQNAFSGAEHLTEFKFPAGIKTIRIKSFYNCINLAGELKIPDTVTNIEHNAFGNCINLTGDLKIPDLVTLIGSNAFEGCMGFDGELVLSNSLIDIGMSAFQGCSNLTGDLTIPSPTKYIGIGAFRNCSGFNGELYLPDTLLGISNSAFQNCSGLTGDLIIPDSVTNLDGRAFQGCSGFNGRLILPNSITKISLATFYGCSGLNGDLIIPDSVTSIDFEAFHGCSGFNGTLTLPNSLTEIMSYAFNGCNGFIGNLTIPNSVNTIGYFCFNGCSGFTGDLIIPDSVTNIAGYAFNGCSGLDGILKISNSITSIENFTFSGCSGLTGTLTIPDSVTKLGWNAFSGCKGLTGNLIIPESVTEMDIGVFDGCSGFDGRLVIPNSIKKISNNTFSGCSSLTGDLIIPDSVESIGNSAFNGCSGFRGDLVIPDTVMSMGSYAFNRCTGFTGSLKLSNSITRIEDSTFYGCSGLTGSLVISNSINHIGNGAFYNCNNIEKIYIGITSEDSNTNYKQDMINKLPNTSKVIIDASYNLNLTGTWLETTNRTVGKPVVKNVVDGAEDDLVELKGECISLYIPSLHQESNISVLKDNKPYTIPVINNEDKYVFTEPGIYQVTLTTDLGNTSIINFEVEDPTIKEIEENLKEMETIKDFTQISVTRELINSLPESMLKDQLQEQLNNIFPDIELEKKVTSANLDVYIKSENMLSLSLDTNSVTFEEYSGAEPMEKLGAVNLTINSSLPYNLNAYMPTEITSSDGNNKMGIDILNIRESNEGVYKQFENNNDKVILRENCNKGNGINHSIDLKLDSNNAYVADIYKTVIKFEAEQK